MAEMTTTIDKKQKNSERKWTDAQRAAIDVRDKTLLVSAAAGSGKTAVLTERIVKTITDKEKPVSISSLLVVTFTTAAAAEMRERITAAVKRESAAHPEDEHLRRQVLLLPSARIRTIDSFCNEILRGCTDKVGITPSYRIGDRAELDLIGREVLLGLISAILDGEGEESVSPADFEALTDCILPAKLIDELSDVFLKIYHDFSSTEGGMRTLYDLCSVYFTEEYKSPENTPFGRQMMVEAREMLSHFIGELRAVIPELECGAPEEIEFLPAVVDEILHLERAAGINGYFELAEVLPTLALKLPSKKRGVELTDLQVYVRGIKDELNKAIKRVGGYFDFTRADWETLFIGIRPPIRALCDFMARFDELFMAEKRARGVFGYNDIERFVYQCLYENGEPTDVARALRDELFAVYIDEYQDVNSLQNKIFTAISREDNRFMVGDIKQSIYSFRAAEPDIFARMKATLPTYTPGLSSSAASIFMSSNFRSDKGIIDFANGVFDKIFTHTGESIGYREEDKLIYGKGDIDGMPTGSHRPKITVLSSGGGDDDEDKNAVLPREVAGQIKELLECGRLADGSPVRPRDIAIILRDMKGRAGEYSRAISLLGIPVRVADEKSFFLNREVLLVLCLLNSIDNPRRDVYFAGLLRSPIFDFTADELYLVSRGGGDCLYSSLVAYVGANPDFKKGAAVLELIDRYRLLAEGERADRIIRMLYLELGLVALAARGGGKDNLTVLYNYAREHENASYKGIHSFISFINSVIRDGGEFSQVKESSERDEVSIVSVHSSKGLEYPIVFYSDTNKRIQKSLAFDPSRINYVTDFGVSFCLRTPSGLGVVDSPCDIALGRVKARRRYEEEMRVLYVCLTRARERLYVLGAVSGDPEEYVEAARAERASISAYSLRKKLTYLDILLATDAPADIVVRKDAPENKTDEIGEEVEAVIEDRPREVSSDEREAIREMVLDRINYKYPYEELTRLPEKLSVSVLYPGVLDGAEDGASIFSPEDISFEAKGYVPSFISGIDKDESKKRGIATHLFMQFCDVKRVIKNGARAELDRLFAEGFISAEDKARVRVDEIEGFARSELAVAMASAKKLYRELRFNIKLPAEAFTENDERRAAIKGKEVLVQGVIDCVIEQKDGSLRLVDYKTDRLSERELSDERLAEERLRRAHTEQLYYYSIALTEMFGKAPRLTEVYSLPLGRTVEINTNLYEVKKWKDI